MDRVDRNHPPDSLDQAEAWDVQTETRGEPPTIDFSKISEFERAPAQKETPVQVQVLGANPDPTQAPTMTAAPSRIFAWLQLDGVPANVETELTTVANSLGHILDPNGHIDPVAGIATLKAAGFLADPLATELMTAEPLVAAAIAQKKFSWWSILLLASELAPIFVRPQ